MTPAEAREAVVGRAIVDAEFVGELDDEASYMIVTFDDGTRLWASAPMLYGLYYRNPLPARPTTPQAIASLNDVVSELVVGLASKQDPTKGWAHTVVTALAGHTEQLGFDPQITADTVAGWEEEQ